MKGNQEIIELLNEYLAIELTGHRQYLRNSRACKHWCFGRLASIQYDYSLEEMEHAAALIDRILFLEGDPAVDTPTRLEPAGSAIEQLQQDLALVGRACSQLRGAISHSEALGDFASRDLFLVMLKDEEEHIDWLETELDLAERIGAENYLQSQL